MLASGKDSTLAPHAVWSLGVNATLLIYMDHSVLNSITDGSKSDPFCEKLSKVDVPSAKYINGL